MKKSLVYGLVVLIGVNGYAQSSAPKASQVESVQQPILEVVNDPVTTQSTNVQTTVQQPVILQNQPTNQMIIQKQATTVVEDSPLVESKAEILRKQRIEMEQQTESKIVEKLESERIRAEQVRAQKLMDGLDSQKQEQNKALEDLKKSEDLKKTEGTVILAPTAEPLIGPQQNVQVIAPQDAVLIQQNLKENQVQDVNQDVNAETGSANQNASNPDIELKENVDMVVNEDKKQNQFYIGFDAGMSSYSLDNVTSTGAIGASVGMVFDQKYVIEASYSYSKFDIESVDIYGYYDYYSGVYYPVITEMRQHNFASAFKYKFLEDRRLSPYVGALVSLTYRDYDLIQDPSGLGYYSQANSSSWAIDTGAVVGADLKLSDNFSLNLDIRYIFNVTYDIQSEGLQASKQNNYQFGEVIEEAGYWQVLVGGKLTF